MFQGMFRKRGRPPERLPIGGYDKPNDEENQQISDHQLLDAPRQLPLPLVREFDQDVVMQQEVNTGNSLSVQSFLHNMLISYQILKIDDWHLTLNKFYRF